MLAFGVTIRAVRLLRCALLICLRQRCSSVLHRSSSLCSEMFRTQDWVDVSNVPKWHRGFGCGRVIPRSLGARGGQEMSARLAPCLCANLLSSSDIKCLTFSWVRRGNSDEMAGPPVLSKYGPNTAENFPAFTKTSGISAMMSLGRSEAVTAKLRSVV